MGQKYIKKITTRQFYTITLWVIKRVWKINASLITALICMTLVRSFLPAALVLVTRHLINLVVDILNGGKQELGMLWPWLALSCGLTIINSLVSVAGEYLSTRLNAEVSLTITSDIMSHAAQLDLTFFETPNYQDIIERVRSHTGQHVFQLVVNILGVLTSIFQLLSMTAILVVIEPFLLVAILPLGVPYFLFHIRLAKSSYRMKYGRAGKQRWSRYFVNILTKYHQLPEVKILNLAPYLLQKFRLIMEEFREQDRKLSQRKSLGKSTFIAASMLVFYATFARVILRAVQGAVTVGDVVIYGGASSALRNLLENAIKLISSLYEHILYIEDFEAFLQLSPTIDIHEGITPAIVRGEIDIKDLTFAYPGSEHHVLSGISIHIEPGEIVALVGENGAGKTTLAKLIAGLYQPSSGTIFIDDIDLRQWSLAHFQSKLAFVFQEVMPYAATVAENIAYGDWQRLLDDRQEIENIARKTNVHEIIQAMPQGYDTLLGRLFGVYKPSRGQGQNIAIARAFARDAAVLILDEPTSNLDARTEYELFLRFRKLAEKRTTLLISHRFSTVSMADRIIVMDNGEVVENGTHKELLAEGGVYANLYQLHQHQMQSGH